MKLPKGFKIIGPKPYPYQMETIIFGIRNKNCGLLLDMGLGKTRCAIDIARYRLQFENFNKILVVTPTSIMYNWQNEVHKFSEYRAIVLHSENRQDRIYKIQQFKNNYQFGIINYEALLPFHTELSNLNIDLIIFDESARYIKSFSAKRTKMAIYLADKAQSRMILTGTPISNKPLDIWSQFRTMDGGASLGLNFYKFRSKLFKKISLKNYNKFVPRHGTLAYLNSIIYNTCIVFKKEDVLPDLPEKIYHTIKLKTPDNISKVYHDVRNEIITRIEVTDGAVPILTKNIFTQLLRLQTITSGFIKDSNGNIRELKNRVKLTALIEEIESIVDAEESVIVWVKFLHSIRMIKRELKRKGIECITMSGQDANKYERWNTFQKDRSIPVFIGQIESGGIGIQLFKLDSNADTQHMIFYENTYSLDVRQQAEDRIHRIGQKASCRYVDIILEDTIDEKILSIFKRKQRVADTIMKQGVKQWLMF